MQVIDDLTQVDLGQDTILTIGTFDGVHRGHQALVGATVERARATGCLAGLITFHPHPAMVLAPERAPRYLTTPGAKIALLEGLGVDLVVLLPFTRQMAETPAREFVQQVVKYLRPRELWIGADFALGRNREGNASRLQALGEEMAYSVHLFEPVLHRQASISSTRIRRLLQDGSVEEAAELLGRYPSLSGEVVVGAQRGRTLGFPTANLEVRPERAVPADGVYAVFATLGTDRYPAMANVGVRPSFDNGQRTVETHIFDFDLDIYGCDLVVEFVARLRDERRFEDIDDLVTQIERDGRMARQILDAGLQADGHRPEHLSMGDLLSVPCRHRSRELDHTADRALQVWGQELVDLFAGAARGMYAMMADLEELVATEWREIRLQAWDRETLLVDWLNELLFLTEIEELLFVDYHVELRLDLPGPDLDSFESDASVIDPSAVDPAGATLVARVGAVRAPVTNAYIKAATFHDLSIVRDPSGWSTSITFDV